MYIEALQSSGFREEFTYHKPKMPNKNNLYMNLKNTKCNNKEISRKNRKRKIIWFNPPLFCKLVNINIGKYFLKLIDKHFNQVIYYIKYLIGKLKKLVTLAQKMSLK